MKLSFKTELPSIVFILIPFIYLAIIWNTMPEVVPTHFDASGEPDGYGSKSSLIFMIFMLPVLTYGILLAVPYIDPKNRLPEMGKKYNQLKMVLIPAMSLLALLIIQSAKDATIASSSLLFIILGGLFAGLGNYFKTIPHNYFIGIRTPWTLESEEVWKKTHNIGGWIWFIGGILIMIVSFFLEFQTAMYFFLGMTAILTIVPMVYSYSQFQKHKKEQSF